MRELPKLLIMPGEALSASTEALSGQAPVLETPVLKPIDLTRTHGFDVTAERLAEMATSYNLDVEVATLNYDHSWYGPSFGRCERVWLQEGQLWVRYVDLDPGVVDGIRSGKWTRRSSEFVLNHPYTGGWYFTGLALLGTGRPAVPGLPPLQLRSQVIVISGAEPQEDPVANPAEPPAPAPPAAEPPPAAPLTTAEVERLRAEVETLRAGVVIADSLRQKNEALEAREALGKLGARVSPAVRQYAEPLLIRLWGQSDTVKLSSSKDGKEVMSDIQLRDALLGLLSAIPAFEALGKGPMADDDDPGQDQRDPDLVALHSRHKLNPERLAELRAKYQEEN